MKNTEIIDANIVLRYLLNDHEQMSKASTEIIEHTDVFLPFEVCAEVVYVLEKVYNVPCSNICEAILKLIQYPNTFDKKVIKLCQRNR
jgi:predicted nucleic-acid-binding protein